MTEEEANLTRCCGPEGCGGNSAGEPERYCIGARCMGWREIVTVNTTVNFDGSKNRDVRHDGYCGLAGQP